MQLALQIVLTLIAIVLAIITWWSFEDNYDSEKRWSFVKMLFWSTATCLATIFAINGWMELFS